ncbi:PASTA domain-containing protein [Pseudarthrobacter albicanus]|uniref:PASTA domain-containing protein n=1 Tax=Pseudarthrobacter albicanus TaxID=2823873 RepID=UPI001BAE34A5|nr:PASTA domain-containing protein [Pseudarthrobacter albicanus]
MPAIEGKPFKDAKDLLTANGIAYEAVGSDGARFRVLPVPDAIIESADVAQGGSVARDKTVVLHIKGTESELNARAAARATSNLRGLRTPKHLAHRRGVPLPARSTRHSAVIEALGDPSQ